MASLKKTIQIFFMLFLIISTEAYSTLKPTKAEIEAFKELSKVGHVVMDSINPEEFASASTTNLALRQNYDVILIAYVVVKAVCYIYKGIVALFGKRVSTTYLDVPMDRGYNYLSQKVRIAYLAGSRPGENCKNFNVMLNGLCQFAGIDKTSTHYKRLLRAFENAKYTDAKSWGKKDFMFRDKPEGDVKYASIMITRYEDEDYVYVPNPDKNYDEPLCTDHEKYYTLFLYLDVHVAVAGNISIERTETKWGIWKDKVSSTIIESNRGIEAEDIEPLFVFFNLMGLKALKNKFGVEEEDVPIKTTN